MNYKKRHRTLALLMALLIVFFTLPLSSLAVDTLQLSDKKGSDFSENTYISGQLQIIFDRLVYSDTPYFTVQGGTSCGNAACTSCGLVAVSKSHPALADLALEFPSTAYGSGAFARYAFALIFGTKLQAINYFGNTVATIPLQTVGRVSIERSAGVPAAGVSGSYTIMSVENLMQILKQGTPGDLIQARSTGGGNHSMILLEAGQSSVTILHSIDYEVTGIEKNKVVISEMTYESMIENWGQIITLFRADAATYSETWAKGETIHLTHRYADETGNNCAVCGKLIDPLPQTSAAGAGVYMASVATNAYASYYRSAAKKASISVGTWVVATGSLTNAVGKTFYLLENGTFVPAEDFSTGAGTAPAIELTTFPSGQLIQGAPFGLRGTVSLSSGLSAVTGYILSSEGTVLQSVPQSTTATSLSLGSSTVNSKLRFGILEPGGYVMMITAKGQNGSMAAKTYPFTVVAEAEKTTPAAPSAPTVSSKTATTVTLKSIVGYEYSKNGTTWQTGATFTGLSAATTYKFYQRVAATATSYASAASPAVTVTTDKADVGVPAAPTVASKTATSVTLKSVSGYEYSKNGTTWQTSPTFTGLSPATTYNFYQRVAATATSKASAASEPTAVCTDKTGSSKPAAPTLSATTSTSVTLKSITGYEYSKNGTTWQTSPTFTGLSPATSYSFYQRVAATSASYASEASDALTVITDKASVSRPSAPTLASKTASSVTLKSVSGYEYSKNGTIWQTSPTFTGLSPATSYSFYQRVAETATTYPSSASVALMVSTDKASVSRPSAPTLASKTASSVTLKSVSGYEYSKNGTTWQTSPTFTGLSPAVSYSFYQRVAETETTYASAASDVLTVTTDKASVSKPLAPTVSSKTDTTVTLKSVDGYEYSKNGTTWQTSPIFTGLSPATAYNFYQRVAETATAYASPASSAFSVTTLKRTIEAPDAPKVKRIDDLTVMLQEISGAEYSVDSGKHWQESPKFVLSSYGTYTFVVRFAETDDTYASEASVSLRVAVNPRKITSSSLVIHEDAHMVSGVTVGMRVADVLDGINESAFVKVTDALGKQVGTEERVKTGMHLILPEGEEYILAVRGDLEGDGQIDVLDLMQLKLNIVNGTSLTEEALFAADVNADGAADLLDYAVLRKCILQGTDF